MALDIDNTSTGSTEAAPATPEATPATPAPAAEQTKGLLDEAAVNKIVSARVSREVAKVQKAQEEQMARMMATMQPQPTQSDDIARKLAQHDETIRQLTEAKTKAEEASAKATAEKHQRQLQESLVTLGATNLKGAMAVLKADGVIGTNEAGELIFKGATQDQALAEGLREWLGTDEGKFYVAPRDLAGSGAGPSTRVRPVERDDPEARRAEARSVLSRALGGFR